MTNSVEDQYVNLLARSIPAATIKRNKELFLKFLDWFPNPLAVKQMSRAQRSQVLEWGPEMRALRTRILQRDARPADDRLLCG